VVTGQDFYSQPGVYRGIPNETQDEPSDTKGLVASVATLLFSLPALGTHHLSCGTQFCTFAYTLAKWCLPQNGALQAISGTQLFHLAACICSRQLMLAAPVGWIPRSHSFSRGEVVLTQYQLWFHLSCTDQLGSVCSLEVSSAQVSIHTAFSFV